MKYKLIILREDLTILDSTNIKDSLLSFAEDLLSSGILDTVYNLTKKVKIKVTEDTYSFESDNLEKLFLDFAYFIDMSTSLFKLKEKREKLKEEASQWSGSSKDSLCDAIRYFPHISRNIRILPLKK